MKKIKIGFILAIIMLIGILATTFASYANNEDALYVNLTYTDATGIGYGIGNPKSGGKYIWNINTNTDTERNLYCIRADYGYSWQDSTDETNPPDPANIVTYNLSYDMQTELEGFLEKIVDDKAGSFLKTLLDKGSANYNKLIWILDNAYVAGTTNKDEFLAKAGIKKGDYTFSLTDADIKAVQKAAIWYYTNSEDDAYNQTTATDWLNITTNGATSYSALSFSTPQSVEGEQRNSQANILYNYLINSAIDTYEGKNTITVDTTGLQGENNNYILPTKIINGKYITGPIKIQKANNSPYDIDIAVINNSGEDIEFKYTNANGEEIENATIEGLVGTEFYISTALNTIDELNIEIEIIVPQVNKTLWVSGNVDTDTGNITLYGEQPLVELERVEDPITVKFTTNPFDLALRKYITAVHDKNNLQGTGKEIPNARELDISLAPLVNETGYTANYNHRKDPVEVKDGDIVTYTLAIYNEGSKEGYATKIVDQLPTGLIWNNNSESTVTSNKGNVYTIEWDQISLTKLSALNQITLTIQDKVQPLKAYTVGGQLDYETIEIECKVATSKLNTEKEIVLTNVAWIAEATDALGNTVIDRDSEPETIPTVDKDTMSEYRGTTTDEELSREDVFFTGQQDDDDFEKVVVKKKFDLALFKHIAAISKDQTIEDGEYITTNKNSDGTYLRAPVAVGINKETGEITYEQNKEEPLIVEPGDYVLYTIRVYNEGEINGYASEIKDRLPEGLVFVGDNTEYNWIWKLNEELAEQGIQELTTTYLAKGNGKEQTQAGANLLKALDKEAAASDVEPKNPDYRDVQVLCMVEDQAPTGNILINYAQISKDTDENEKDIVDKDSEPDNSTPEDWKGEDDEDTEKIILQCFDLSLRKFVTAIGKTELKDNQGNYIRAPKVDVTPLKEGKDTAIYKHAKQPIAVQPGEKIVYTIRVYNEGKVDGFASEVTDYLPKYLAYDKNSEINRKYNWQISEDGRIATTTYLSSEEFKLAAFDPDAENAELDYADVQIECIVAEDVPLKVNQTNIAEISEYRYNDNTVMVDRDSIADNMVNEDDTTKDYLPSDEELPAYKDDKIDLEYVPGNEDDDDFEKIYVKQFDLALRKFITKVQGKEITTRVPQPKIENGKISYEHSKDALTVHVGDVITYKLRIYNEGEIAGYASEITDDIPEYLEFLPEDSTNVTYMWKMYDENGNETENVEDAVSVKTTYLSKQSNEKNLINAFDGTELDYKDIQIAFKVKDPNSNTYIITNYAQISEDTDENNNPINDNDSDTEKWVEGDDDQDIENVKVEYFDLSLLKFVSKVIIIEDGKEKISETGYNGHENPEPVVKVELHKKKLNNVVVKFGYGITITNEGDIAGYATELTDYVPEGLKFDPNDNPDWTDEGNNVISTRQLEGMLLQPGESTTIEVIFTWINSPDNLALKTNTAEISEDKNEYDVPDIDSTPDNKVDGEDDIDIAKVILNISTGAVQTYFTLTLGLLAVILVGIALIKKFVL